MVVPLKPLHDRWGVKRVVCSTYQAVSGAGSKGIYELEQQVADLAAGREPKIEIFPKQIAYNAIPRIPQSGGLFDDGYLHEEVKMIKETVKIFGDESIRVTATCVRVPIIRCHSETLNVELEKPFTLDEVREALAGAEGVTVQDDVANDVYPVPLECSNLDDVFVGRLRLDNTNLQAVNMWICGDQIRKGAALNAIQIAEDLVRQGLLAARV
jgi:aspartate-semialdehyde dehydrogenase